MSALHQVLAQPRTSGFHLGKSLHCGVQSEKGIAHIDRHRVVAPSASYSLLGVSQLCLNDQFAHARTLSAVAS